jgi:hypothetical protein
MRIDLNSLDAAKSKEFLDYFNAALRSKGDMPLGPSGSGQFTEQGYQANLDDWIKTSDGGSTGVAWTLQFDNAGKLASIEVMPKAAAAEETWGGAAQAFVNEILVAVLSSKKTLHFKRRHFSAFIGANLSGEYWLPGYRFAPQFVDDDSHLLNSERYLVIDMEVDSVDSMHADELADERAGLAAAHLSFITDVGLSKPVHEQRWFLTHENGEIKQHRESTQHIDLAIPSRMPSKNELCKSVQFSGSVFDSEKYANSPFSCPSETRQILRGLETAQPNLKSAFNKCALLYQLALTIGRYHPTVRISYEYAAVNAIAQELGGNYSGFSDFVRKNSPGENVDSLLEYIHSRIRSAHWHGGEFALGETSHRRDFLTNPEGHVRFNISRAAHRVIRTALFNWVIREIAGSSNA